MSSPHSSNESNAVRRFVDPAKLEELRQKAMEHAAQMRDTRIDTEITTTITNTPTQHYPTASMSFHPVLGAINAPPAHPVAYHGNYPRFSAPLGMHPLQMPMPQMYAQPMGMTPYPYHHASMLNSFPFYPYSPQPPMSHPLHPQFQLFHPPPPPPAHPYHPLQHPFGAPLLVPKHAKKAIASQETAKVAPKDDVAKPEEEKGGHDSEPTHQGHARTLNLNLRSFPSIRAIVDSDHKEDIDASLELVRNTAWFYQPEKVKPVTDSLVSELQESKQPFGHPLLTSVHHIRPLQWYGYRMRSFSRGWVAPNAREESEAFTEQEFKELDNDSSKVWTVVSFAILDANARAFPLLMEWCEGDTDGGTTPRAFIYTCKRDLDDPSQPGPDVCVGRIVSVSDSESQVTIDLPRLKAAWPLFTAAFQPHTVDAAARAHCALNDEPFRTYRTFLERKKSHSDFGGVALFNELPENVHLHNLIEEWKKEPHPTDKADELLSQFGGAESTFRFAVGENDSSEAAQEFSTWRSKLRKFYATMSANELLQNQLEVMCAAMALQLLPKREEDAMPVHQYTENQPRDLRLRLTVEVLKRLPPQQAKVFTSAALPPLAFEGSSEPKEQPLKKQRTEYHSNTSASESKWPHAEATWGLAETRPLPDDLISLIAEYALDELELVDLPWIEKEEEELIAAASNESFGRARKIVYGVHPEDDDFGDHDDDDK